MVSNFGIFFACMRDDGDGGEYLDLRTTSGTEYHSREFAAWEERQKEHNPGQHYWDIHPVTRVVKIEIRPA